jgi:lipid A 3-O-deacylase PagL
MRTRRHGGALVGALAILLLTMTPADAGWLKYEEGRWRVETSGAVGFSDADDDFYSSVAVEYEMPTAWRASLGLRVYPMFLYSQDEPSDTIYGAMVGVRSRFYHHQETQDGMFLEFGPTVLFTTDKLEGNSSSVNFLSELGVGYKFRTNPWHVGVKVQHISNAGLGSDNSNHNGVALAVGYTF